MGYAILWIESLATALLFAAALMAYGARLRRRRLGHLLFGIALFVPLTLYAGATLGLWILDFDMRLGTGLFFPALFLTACFAAGAFWIRVCARPKPSGGGDLPGGASSWPAGKLAIAFLASAALHMMTFSNLDHAVNQEIRMARAEASALALSIAPASVPDRENAAPLYLQAIEAMAIPEEWPEIWRDAEDAFWKVRGDFDFANPELVKLLESEAPALALFREAAARPACRFDRDYCQPSFSWRMDELTGLRRGMLFLAMDARRGAAARDLPSARKDIEALFAMAVHTAGEPVLISVLVASAIDEWAFRALESLLESPDVSEDDLASLKIDGEVSYKRLFGQALRMEEASVASVICEIARVSDYLSALRGSSGSSDFYPLRIPGFGPAYRIFLFQDDLAAYRTLMERIRRPLEGAYPFQDLVALSKAELRGLMTPMLGPPMLGILEKAPLADARRRVARLALAVCRHRARSGKPPERLEDLVPSLASFVPRDPFDGKPIRFRRTDRGLAVYSIGPDLKDDGGARFDRHEKKGDVSILIPEIP